VRWPIGVAAGIVGALAALPLGAPIGAIIGGAVGYHAGSPGALQMLFPLSSVAGVGGTATHDFVHKNVAKIFGERAGSIAGKTAGLVAGAVTGTAIGALGFAWAGYDFGLRAGLSAGSKIVGPPGYREPKPGHKSYEKKWLAQIPTPDGRVDPESHHTYFMKYGLQVLQQDAKTNPALQKVAAFMASDPDYAYNLKSGATDMDDFLGVQGPGISLSTFFHFREPFMPGLKDAFWQTRQCYDKAADVWKSGDRKLAMYYLGAALHSVQDGCYPQHAVKHVSYVGKMLGHQMMEDYMQTRGDEFVAKTGEYLPNATRCEEYEEHVGARSSSHYFGAVAEAWQYVKHPDGFQPKIYADYWRNAQAITPGFIEFFFRDMEKQGYPI
jgi:hypothetical protein